MPGIAAVRRATAPTRLFTTKGFPVPAPSSRADYLRPSSAPMDGGRIFRAAPHSQHQELSRR